MAELKLNQDLHISTGELATLKSMYGNMRLVGYGVVDATDISATSWWERGFVGGSVVYDKRYLTYHETYRNFKVKKTGKYFFIWQLRGQNGTGQSQGVGISINNAYNTDGGAFVWEGGCSKNCIMGAMPLSLNANDIIATKGYSQAAITQWPVSVWIFAMDVE